MPRLNRRTTASALVVVYTALALGTGSPAIAQDVMVDPDSPAGTEYAIPIQSAREQGTGDSDEIFGEGISSGSTGSAGQSGSDAASDDAQGAENGGSADTGATETNPSATTAPGEVSQLAAENADDDSGSRGLLMVIIASLLVMAGAAYGGLRMRRSDRSGT